MTAGKWHVLLSAWCVPGPMSGAIHLSASSFLPRPCKLGISIFVEVPFFVAKKLIFIERKLEIHKELLLLTSFCKWGN